MLYKIHHNFHEMSSRQIFKICQVHIVFAIAIKDITGCWWQGMRFSCRYTDNTKLSRVFRGLQAVTWVHAWGCWTWNYVQLGVHRTGLISQLGLKGLWIQLLPSTVILHRRWIERCRITLETWRTSHAGFSLTDPVLLDSVSCSALVPFWSLVCRENSTQQMQNADDR
jgi:hypothetical protein